MVVSDTVELSFSTISAPGVVVIVGASVVPPSASSTNWEPLDVVTGALVVVAGLSGSKSEEWKGVRVK